MEPRYSNLPKPPIGVIEALSSGFEIISGHLVLLLIPVVLDLFLWMGPRLTLQPVLRSLYLRPWLPFVTQETEEWQTIWEPITQFLAEGADEQQLVYLPMVGVPSLIAAQDAEALPFGFVPPVLSISNVSGLIALVMSLLLAGTLLGTLYIAMVAQQIRDGTLRIGPLLKQLPLMWARLLGFIVLALIILNVVLTPFFIMSVLLLFVNEDIASATLLFGACLTLWTGLFLFFTAHGIVMNGRRVFGALIDSVRVVQWNLSGTMFLLLLVITLSLGLGLAWSLAPTGSWIALLAIGGNAFVTTGLIAATFIFFKDRHRYWQEIRAALLAEAERQWQEVIVSKGGKEDGT